MFASSQANGTSKCEYVQHVGDGGLFTERKVIFSQQGHSTQAWIDQISVDLTELERRVADLRAMCERYRQRKAALFEQELQALDAVLARWAHLWGQLYGAFVSQTVFWTSAHIEKVVRVCMQKGHSAFLWLAEFALSKHGRGEGSGQQEILTSLSIVESACNYLTFYEAWCLLKNHNAPADIGGDLVRVIFRHPLIGRVSAKQEWSTPPNLLRRWLLLSLFRKHLAGMIDVPRAIRLINEVIRNSSNSRFWLGKGEGPNDSVVLLMVGDGGTHLGVEIDLPSVSVDNEDLNWLIPWRAVYESLLASGNKEHLVHLL